MGHSRANLERPIISIITGTTKVVSTLISSRNTGRQQWKPEGRSLSHLSSGVLELVVLA